MIIIDMPIRARISKNKWFWMNLNQYRNTYHKTTNKAKRWFTEFIMTKNLTGSFSGSVHIHYEIWPKKRSDLMNVGSILDKFLQDALIACQVIPDDSCKVVKSVSFEFMGYEHPGRANAEITRIGGA